MITDSVPEPAADDAVRRGSPPLAQKVEEGRIGAAMDGIAPANLGAEMKQGEDNFIVDKNNGVIS